MTIVDCWNAKFWAESCSPMTGSVLTWSCVNNETLSSPAELFSAFSYLHLKQCHRVIQHLDTNTHHLPALPRCSRRSLARHSSIQTSSIHLRIVSGECPQRHLWLICLPTTITGLHVTLLLQYFTFLWYWSSSPNILKQYNLNNDIRFYYNIFRNSRNMYVKQLIIVASK